MDAFNLEWKLPSKVRDSKLNSYLTNKLLLESLIVPLAQYNEEVNSFWMQEKRGKTVSPLALLASIREEALQFMKQESKITSPIEAAHRSVIQQRMKLSGQKWSIEGAQAMADLRCYKHSGAEHHQESYCCGCLECNLLYTRE